MNRKIAFGVLWNLATLMLGRGASIIFTLFLARLLAPEAFGLIAMTAVIFEVADVLIQSGLGHALIRSRNVSHADLSTVFLTNIGLSIIAYGAQYFLAPQIAAFYGEPELTPLVRVAGLIVLLNAFKVVQTAIFRRELNFKPELIATSTGALISGVGALCLAYFGAGVWSLVAQLLLAAAASSAVLWTVSDWRPSLIFNPASFNRLFGFGSQLALEGVIEVVYQNSYIFVVGRLFSAELTGLYFFARKIIQLVSHQLSRAVEQAIYPALAPLQDDNSTLREKYRQIVHLTLFTMAPVMSLMAVLADPLFSLLFGDRWGGAVLYVQLLAIVGALHPLHALNVNVLNLKGRSDLVVQSGLLKKGMGFAILFATMPFGLTAIVAGQALGSILSLVPNMLYTYRLIEYRPAVQITEASKPLAAALLAGGASYSTRLLASDLSPLVQLLSAGSLGLLVYLVGCAAVGAEGYRLTMQRAAAALRLRYSSENR
ncbi:MAG TPA: lipopolysaccharide biosynthesis protein [Trueperaceae bacterium]